VQFRALAPTAFQRSFKFGHCPAVIRMGYRGAYYIEHGIPFVYLITSPYVFSCCGFSRVVLISEHWTVQCLENDAGYSR
jgi:hypothetical protein